MKKKRSLTLLEVIIAMMFLGILLACLFSSFRQGVKKSIFAKELKQKVLQLELFQQRLRNLLTNEKTEIWLGEHPEVSGTVLFVSQYLAADMEFGGDSVQEMLYLNDKKQLCLVTWSEKNHIRVEILLDKIESFKCRLFDTEEGEWLIHWPKKKENSPAMIGIDLKWEGNEIPFVFFPSEANEQISYSGS